MGKLASMPRTAPPPKIPNLQKRTREHLLPQEVEAMIKVARGVGRHGNRDATLILLAYRHGLRVSELVALRWEQVDFSSGTIYINRLKQGVSSTHPLRGPELRSLRQLQRDYPGSPYLFVSERRAAMAADTARGIIERAGQLAGIPFPVHPHMLRHACGFYLASRGHDTRAIQAYLGHKNIQHTVRYTELAPGRFKDFWMD
ncbi:MAG: tyrosine-type recombinase/integrase [Coleofasciculus sp. C3-bin4]|nr:tyrosine-type recombinase/integrase [Coleofasciculus sp. C3-bin4]